MTNDTVLVASKEAVESFSDDVKHLWCPRSVPVLEQPPPPETFYREYVSTSTPCIIRNAILNKDDQNSLSITLDELCQQQQQQEEDDLVVTVDVTPDGHGDCVRTVQQHDDDGRKRMFVKPQEQKMTLNEFRDRLRRRKQERRCECTDENGKAIYPLEKEKHHHLRDKNEPNAQADDEANGGEVLYYSRQNDCLRTELCPLFESGMFPETISFAEQAFGVAPDAVNLWIGNEQAVSSMHKDHYENCFYVCCGEKIFTLCPPADAPFLYQKELYSGTFSRNKGGEWVVQQDYNAQGEVARVQWIEGNVEPLVDACENGGNTVCKEHPLLPLAHPIRVHVKAGEMLYLPALWFHRVTQTCETVGVNYWFDMRFDGPMWCYFNFLQQLRCDNKKDPDNDS